MQIIDLSYQLNNKIPIYPGDPKVEIEIISKMETDGYQVSRIQFGTHSGTHIDLPAHFIKGGLTADKFNLEAFIGDAIVVNLPYLTNPNITVKNLAHLSELKDKILIINSGWSAKFNSEDFFTSHPQITLDAAQYLIQSGIKLIACDMPSVEQSEKDFPVHKKFLEAGIPIVQMLCNLDKIENSKIQFIALPLKIKEGDGSPARAVGII